MITPPAALTVEQTCRKAISLAMKGYHVFPVRVVVDPETGKNTKSYPTRWVTGGPGQAATTDLDIIRAWWSAGSPVADCMIGIATGPSTAVFVDIDVKNDKDGRAAWAAAVPAPYPMPAAIAQTSSGGFHYPYRADPARPVVTGSDHIARGIDTRAIGGMVVAWGSWLPAVKDLPPCPDVVLERAARPIGPAAERVDVEARGWLLSFGPAETPPCPRVAEVTAKVVRRLDDNIVGGRHAAALNAAATLTRFLAEGHRGSWAGLVDVRAAFLRAYERTGQDGQSDWLRMLRDVISTAAALPRAGFDPCDTPGAWDPLDPRTGSPRPDAPGWAPPGPYGGPGGWAPPFPGPANGRGGPPPVRLMADGSPMDPAAAAVLDATEQRARVIDWKADEQEVLMRARDIAQRRIRGEFRAEPPASIDLGALLEETDEPVAFRVDNLLPEGGRVVLAAQRKSGKTTMVTNLVRCLADGGMFLDRFAVKPPAGRVVIMDFEMIRGQIRHWLRLQDVVAAKRVEVHTLRGHASAFDILDDRVRAGWARMLMDQDCGVLVIDCLRPIMDALGLDESHDAGRFLVAVDALMVEASIGEGILVHHAGHNGERSRGDSRLRDWPDVEWRIMRERPEREGEEPPPDGPRYFSAEGRGVSLPEETLLFDARGHRLSLESGNRADGKKQRQETAVLGAIIAVLRDASGPLTQREVEAMVTGKAETIRLVLANALMRRLVVRTDGIRNTKMWSLPS